MLPWKDVQDDYSYISSGKVTRAMPETYLAAHDQLVLRPAALKRCRLDYIVVLPVLALHLSNIEIPGRGQQCPIAL